jgi:hypothetical protein
LIRYTLKDLLHLARKLAGPVLYAYRSERWPGPIPRVRRGAWMAEEFALVETVAYVMEWTDGSGAFTAVLGEAVEARAAAWAEVTQPADSPAQAPETLYIRSGSGKGRRYSPASDGAVGLRWRRVAVGKRVRYVPADPKAAVPGSERGQK